MSHLPAVHGAVPLRAQARQLHWWQSTECCWSERPRTVLTVRRTKDLELQVTASDREKPHT